MKMTNTRYNRCKNPDRSELLTKDLKVVIDCTVMCSNKEKHVISETDNEPQRSVFSTAVVTVEVLVDLAH